MAWLDDSVILLRSIIGDDFAPFTYCNTRLSDLLVSTARMLIFDVYFATEYTVNISTSTISPDPSDDPFFTPLLVLKAATRIADSEYKAAAASSFQVVDGPSSINLTSQVTALKERIKRMYDNYEQAKLQYALGNAIGCAAILTPTTSGTNSNGNQCFNYRDQR